MPSTYDYAKAIRMLISQAKTLQKSIELALADTATQPHSRFVSFKTFAEQYNFIAKTAEQVLGLKENSFTIYLTEKMQSHMSTVWPVQKEIMESVFLSTGILLTYLESATEFAENEFDNIENFIICGCCTDLCVLQFALSLKTDFNRRNLNKRVVVIQSLCETYDGGSHGGDISNLFAFYNMKTNGIEVPKDIVF